MISVLTSPLTCSEWGIAWQAVPLVPMVPQGMVHFGLGTDTGGSVRVPAAYQAGVQLVPEHISASTDPSTGLLCHSTGAGVASQN